MKYTAEYASKERTTTNDKCSHHWIIEASNGPTSMGICKLCGAERKFFNSFSALAAVSQDTPPGTLPELIDREFDREAEFPVSDVVKTGKRPDRKPTRRARTKVAIAVA